MKPLSYCLFKKEKEKKIGISSQIDFFVLIFPSVNCYRSIDIVPSSSFFNNKFELLAESFYGSSHILPLSSRQRTK